MMALNNVSNIHVHQLNSGGMVIHAHPFNKNQDSAPVKKHHHTTCDFVQIQTNSNLFLTIVQITCFAPEDINTTVYLPKYTNNNKGFIHTSKNKAPPFSV